MNGRPTEIDMASSPQHRLRFTTDINLLKAASSVPLFPPKDKVVLYAEDEGIRLATDFIAKNPSYVRLDELLSQTTEGRALWSALTTRSHTWSDIEEVWWELSWRLARAAKGKVNVFGPKRLAEERPLEEFRHKYSTGSFANTVFEKVELPELEANPHVTEIYYNGNRFA